MASIAVLPGPTPVEYYSQGLRKRFHLDGLKVASPDKTPEPAAEIQYEFDQEKFFTRREARLGKGGLETNLPDGFPAEVVGPLNWSRNDFQAESDYVVEMTPEHGAEVQSAVKAFLGLGVNHDQVCRANFPLPTLGPELEQIRDDVYHGRGFAILRGLDVDSYTADELAIVYLGITSYVAEARGKQNQQGAMLMHVMNKDKDDAYANKNTEKPFHTDTVCDVLCLLTKEVAPVGGRSIISSAWTVYNELAATRPDIIHTLARSDWPFDTNGRNPAYYRRALLYNVDDKIIMNMSRRLLTGCAPMDPRTPGIPGLTEAQADALDTVHYVARNHEIRTPMKKGDLRFLNNMGVLHRREAFEDDGTTQRHLIRLWLHNKQHCWALPAALHLAWARIFEDDERGERWDVEPVRGPNGQVLRVASSCD